MTVAAESSRYRFAHFELQPGERRLLSDGVAVVLRPLAFDLLSALVERAGHLVTKDELLQRVWGKVIVEENTLQAHISALRKVLGPEAIATVSGQGYRFTLQVAPVQELPAPRHNLPQQLTSFIGREREIAEVRRWLTSTRLLTLTGAGGCGKTRLALQVADASLDSHSDGVWLVELAPLGDPTLVGQAVAKALAIQEQPGKDLVETVTEWLGSRQLLLVLDNAEHLLEACAQFADRLLRCCDRLVILVTSRERLGIAGEMTYRVPSLSVPDGPDASREDILACEAARLFVDRARLQRPDFEVTPQDAAALASICRRLDGIALAIELAAPRMRAMSLVELGRHLDDRFGLLTAGSRTALPRHRTLRALIDWSHGLLGEAEKAVLRRASVFGGGWTVEAAQRVCSGDGVDGAEVLNLLTSLADKSLVVAETRADETRFGLLETVRHYAQDRLRESGEDESVRERHLEYFQHMAERLDEAQTDDERQSLLSRLDPEHDNLRAALAWCEAAVGRAVAGLRLAGRLHWFWSTRGASREGRDCIARLLGAAPDGERGRAHAMALFTSGSLLHPSDNFAAAEAPLREALAIWERLGDRRQIMRSLGSLGNIAMLLGDRPTARALFEQALAVAREIGDRHGAAMGLYSLGSLAFEHGDLEAAQAFLEESASTGGEVRRHVALHALAALGRICHLRGDFPRARTLLNEALEGYRAFGDQADIATQLANLGALSRDEGDIATARLQLGESLAIQHTLRPHGVWWPEFVATTLQELAGLSPGFASPLDAARLLGAAQRLRERAAYPRPSFERDRYERLLAAARSALNDDAAFERAWAEGRSWSVDEAMRYALSL